MGTNSPESYFATVTVNKVKYGVVNCYDGHSIDADTLEKMSKDKYTHFYNVNDGCYSEHYVICSHTTLSQKEISNIDEQLAKENEG